MLLGLSHRKLLMQTEEAIEAQLNDAQKRLSDVHRVSLFPSKKKVAYPAPVVFDLCSATWSHFVAGGKGENGQAEIWYS